MRLTVHKLKTLSSSAFLFAVLYLIMGSLPANAKPPYQVVGYCNQNTEAPPNSVNDTGQGTAINWSTDVPWNDLTVVADAFLIPKTNDTFTNSANGNVLITAAHAQNVRCIVSLGGAGQDTAFPTLSNSAANITAFAKAVTAMVSTDGYDGVDIDWETAGAAPQANATAMMEGLYAALKALPNCSVDGKPHTLSFTTNPSYSTIFDMTTLASYSDWCLFMGYDWYDYPPNVNGPLNGINPSIVSSITGMTNGSQWSYPMSKMVLGCPLYTNDYNAGTEIDTVSIINLGTAGAYSTTYAEQVYTAPDGQTVYVDTAQSYCDKINWAVGNGAMGIGMWDMGQGLPTTANSMMTSIWNTIGGNSACLTVVGSTSTPTNTATVAVHTSTPTLTATLTSTNTVLLTSTPTLTATKTATLTFTNTTANTATFTNTFTKTITNTPTNTLANTSTITNTASKTATYTVTSTATNTPAITNTVTSTFTQTPTYTHTSTATNTITSTIPPDTATPSNTSTSTHTNTVTNTLTLVITNTPTITNTGTLIPTNTFTQTPTYTHTSTVTNTATKTYTNTVTNTFTLVITNTPTLTPTATMTDTGTLGPTNTFTNTITNTLTGTVNVTSTATLTLTNTPMNTFTNTATSTPSFTPSATATRTYTNTITNTYTNTATNTATQTTTSSFTPSATTTNSFTNTNTSTFTSTPTFTDTTTPVDTSTHTSTATSTYTVTPTPALTNCPGIPVWSGNAVVYGVGQDVGYNGYLYQCVQAHTSEPNWEPPVVPALWKEIGPCGTTPTQTSGTGNPVIYPNPVTSSSATIQLPEANATNVKIQIFTIAFREVQTIKVAQVVGQTIQVPLVDKSGMPLADGLYYFVIQANGQKWTNKVLVLR